LGEWQDADFYRIFRDMGLMITDGLFMVDLACLIHDGSLGAEQFNLVNVKGRDGAEELRMSMVLWNQG